MNGFRITLQQAAKRFGRQWLFQNVSVLMKQGNTYALTGSNGSGKSTLLQIIYGYQVATRGNILIHAEEQALPPSELYRYSSFVAPYMELPEELTLREQLEFHFTFKPLRSGYDVAAVMEAVWLGESAHKKIKHFSSGMKQRVKLAQAFYSDTPVLFLDEPCTNLDSKGMAWYRDTILELKPDRLIVVASNQPVEYDFADEVIEVKA